MLLLDYSARASSTTLVNTTRELASDSSLNFLRDPLVEILRRVLWRPPKSPSPRTLSARVGAEDEQEANRLKLLLLEWRG